MATPLQFFSLDKDTIFHRLDPRTKLVFVGVQMAVLLVFLYTIEVMIVALVANIILFYVAKIPRSMMIYTVLFSVSTVISFTLIGGFFIKPGMQIMSLAEGVAKPAGEYTPITLFTVGGSSFLYQGALYGAITSFRIVVPMFGALLLSCTTDPTELLVTLSKVGLPDILAFATSTTLRLIPLFTEEVLNITNAMKTRGIGRRGRIRGEIDTLRNLFEPMLIGSLRRSNEMAFSVEARAFGTTRRTHMKELKFKKADYIVLAILMAVLGGLILLRYGYRINI